MKQNHLFTPVALLAAALALLLMAPAQAQNKEELAAAKEFRLQGLSANDSITERASGEIHVRTQQTVKLKDGTLVRLGLVFQNRDDYLTALELDNWDIGFADLRLFTIIGSDNEPAELSTSDGSFSLDSLPSRSSSTICSDVIAQARAQLTPNLVMGVRFHAFMQFSQARNGESKIGYCEPVFISDVFNDCDFFPTACLFAFPCVNYFYNDRCELTVWNGSCRVAGSYCRCL